MSTLPSRASESILVAGSKTSYTPSLLVAYIYCSRWISSFGKPVLTASSPTFFAPLSSTNKSMSRPSLFISVRLACAAIKIDSAYSLACLNARDLLIEIIAGMAIAQTIAMMPTTVSSSVMVKPFFLDWPESFPKSLFNIPGCVLSTNRKCFFCSTAALCA